MALEEGVAVGVGMFGGADVSVEGVGGRADRQLLWSHWLSCWDDRVVGGKLATGMLSPRNKMDRTYYQSVLHEDVSWHSSLSLLP